MDKAWQRHATTLPRQLFGGVLAGAALPWLLMLKDAELRQDMHSIPYASAGCALVTPVVILLMHAVSFFWRKRFFGKMFAVFLGFLGIYIIVAAISLACFWWHGAS